MTNEVEWSRKYGLFGTTDAYSGVTLRWSQQKHYALRLQQRFVPHCTTPNGSVISHSKLLWLLFILVVVAVVVLRIVPDFFYRRC